MKHKVILILLATLLLALDEPSASWAYVDPNTVGFASQFLAPLGTLLVSCLIYFRRQLGTGLSALLQWFRKREPQACPEARPDGTDS
jgi:hypothetical protein